MYTVLNIGFLVFAFHVLAAPHGMQDLRSPVGDQTYVFDPQ